MTLLKWLTTLKVYVVVVEDNGIGQGFKLNSIHFTLGRAEHRIKQESSKRWERLTSDADKWLVKWSILEMDITL